MDDSELETELDLLRSIYFEELDIGEKEKDGHRTLVMRLRPQTGMNEDEVFVRTDLRVTLPPKYPDDLPSIELFNMRGLGDEDVSAFMREMGSVAEENRGCPMVYQMFELGKEHLNQLNQAPRGECVVCLEGFSRGSFMKTPCYHHLHVPCFSSYVRSEALDDKDDNVLVRKKKKSPKEPISYPPEIPCPVCRAPVPTEGYTTQHKERERLAREEHFQYVPDARMVLQQHWMQRVYQQQMEAGGIIDVERERARFHLDSATPVYVDTGAKPATESEPPAPSPDSSKPPTAESQPPNTSTTDTSSTNTNNNTAHARKHDGDKKPHTHSHSHRGGRHRTGRGGGESSRQYGEGNGREHKHERGGGEQIRAHTSSGRGAEGEKRGDTKTQNTGSSSVIAEGSTNIVKEDMQMRAGEPKQASKGETKQDRETGETVGGDKTGEGGSGSQNTTRGEGISKGGNERNSRGRGRGRPTQEGNTDRSLAEGHVTLSATTSKDANALPTSTNTKATPVTNENTRRKSEAVKFNTTVSAGIVGENEGKTAGGLWSVEGANRGGRGRGGGLVRGRGRGRGRGRCGGGTGDEDKQSSV